MSWQRRENSLWNIWLLLFIRHFFNNGVKVLKLFWILFEACMKFSVALSIIFPFAIVANNVFGA